MARRRHRFEQRDYSHLSRNPPETILANTIKACSFHGGPRWEFYVNRDLLSRFGELPQLPIGDLVQRYLDMLATTRNQAREEPTPFNFERAGNLIGWGLRLGLLEDPRRGRRARMAPGRPRDAVGRAQQHGAPDTRAAGGRAGRDGP
jgi:hypothetical protein